MVRVRPATTENDWRDADLLMTELKEWDAQQSQARGFDREEVMRIFYPERITDVRRYSASPDGCLLLAMDAGEPAGCAAFRRLTSSACEAYAVYVRPAYRGRRIGWMLLRRLMRTAREYGYRAMCLETASFMHEAHNLYRSLRFQTREPYRKVPDSHAEATLWMECQLR